MLRPQQQDTYSVRACGRHRPKNEPELDKLPPDPNICGVLINVVLTVTVLVKEQTEATMGTS